MTAGATPGNKAPPTGVLERALLVLSCFTEAHPRLHLRELAAHSGLDKATLLRMLGTFAAHGFVRRGEDGRYAPGPAALRLAALYGATNDFPARMMPVLKAVMERTEESAAFYERDGDDRVCVCRVNAPRALRHQVEMGERLPLSAGGAAAHVLLAHTGGETPRAEEVRAQGYLSTAGQRDPGLASVALPVFDEEGRFIGALVVSGPISRQTGEGFERARAIAAELLREQGFSTGTGR
ncbi:transcriptional regulator, IclR family [Roseomonas rosea]|uniref:Transcriptional regulator, IclR family n=1 Tax=Muricoccus roseus TaxID=198092 RepID=A0A1M6D9M5_9PROT|nr:IclR family transcriptional regulator [Roseomonas rosea]SHI69923.1 transcriptional regulator, IclR family [Roseomonas rosea]